MPALGVPSTEHAVSELARAEMTNDEATRRFDVERLAREEIDVRGTVIREGVAACVTLRQKDDAGDGQHAFELVLRDGRSTGGGKPQLRREIDKRLTNAGPVEPGWIAAERVGNPVKSKHG